MKKIIIGIFAILCVGICVFGIYSWKLSTTPDDGSAQREAVEYLNHEVDLSLLLYGEDINFPETLEYEKIDSLESANWQIDSDYVYLIINDLNGTLTFDKESYLELVEYADKNTNFNFYYIGTDDLEMIQNNTIDCNLNSEDMSFGYIVYEGYRLMEYGVWSKNDHQYLEMNPELLSDNIYSAVLMNVKSNE